MPILRVVQTGVGGRLDSSNVLSARIMGSLAFYGDFNQKILTRGKPDERALPCV